MPVLSACSKEQIVTLSMEKERGRGENKFK